jgi:hypothetical protein
VRTAFVALQYWWDIMEFGPVSLGDTGSCEAGQKEFRAGYDSSNKNQATLQQQVVKQHQKIAAAKGVLQHVAQGSNSSGGSGSATQPATAAKNGSVAAALDSSTNYSLSAWPIANLSLANLRGVCRCRDAGAL